MKKYLVTGAAGFLGYYIASQISLNPTNLVVCVDNFVRGENDPLYRALCSKPNVKNLEVDLTDQLAVRQLPDDIDVVFHMAALNGTQNFYERPFEVVRCCTLPTLFLIEKYGPRGQLERFIYAGTSESYASTVTKFGWAVPTSEDVPLSFDDIFNERWSYGASKMHGEVATINGCRHFKVPFTIARFHNAYGPRMGDKHVIPDFMRRARRGVYELFGYEDTRSFIYADDAARATILASESKNTINQVVNIGSEDEITILELARRIMVACNVTGDIVLHKSPKGSVRRRAPCIDKLRELTNFSPAWSLDEGLAATANFYFNDPAV